MALLGALPQHRTLALPVARLAAIAPAFLLCAAIGIELAVLAVWLPDTLAVWRSPEVHGYGDFPSFYRNAQAIHLNATYSPGLSLLMHPLTWFSMKVAFQIYFAINVAALAGVAFLAQGGVRSSLAKIAVVLGVFALPQTHWALRVGHFTEILALAALAGLLLSERRPALAGLLIGVLALKPQYLPVPLLYFAATKNWRALAAGAGALAALALAGLGAMVIIQGAGTIAYIERFYVEAAGYVAQHLTTGQQDQIYVQGWQYSWAGFLISAGIDPNPLLTADLLLLSFGALVLAWWKCTPSVARAATVLGMLLLAPHSTFYNWSMIAAAAALLLRSDLRPRYLVPLIIAALALAMAASQDATPFPIAVDYLRPAGTRGLYWAQPAALLALITLAIAGARSHAADPGVAPALVRARRLPPVRVAGWASFALAGVAAGAIAAAFVTGSGPFRSEAYFGRTQVVRALPADFPVPDGARFDDAGAGSRLPYRIEWDAPAPVSDVAGIMRQRLADGSWKIVDQQADGAGVSIRTARGASAPGAPSLAEVRIAPSGAGSRIRLEFSPLPASSVPGYAQWLESVGLIVHNVDPATDSLAR
jgi:hypothetical protein